MTESTHIKRLKGDIRLLSQQPLEGINVCYDESNMLTWNFLIFGQKDTDYVGGEYVGEIVFDIKYPYTAPEFKIKTPNGRFEIEKKICLSNSNFHQSEWRINWTIHAIILGFVSIMNEEDRKGSVGHIECTKEERKKLAEKSIEWNLKNMPIIYKKLKEDYLGKDIVENSENKKILEFSLDDIQNKIKVLNDLMTVHKIVSKKNKKHLQKHKQITKIISKFIKNKKHKV